MIVVFGSINVDVVMRVEKMPRPGDTILCPSYQLVGGGKGANQAIAAAKAGAVVKFYGCIGDDAFGRIARAELDNSPMDLTHLKVQEGASTGCAVICVDAPGENMITVASGVNHALRASDVPDSLFSQETTLLLQMETLPEENWTLIRRAKKRGARIILNLAPACALPSDVFPHIDVLIVNQHEAALLALHLGTDVASPAAAARHVVATYGLTCVVTLGSQGTLTCSPEGTWKTQAMDIQAIDTTAAGDAFVGVLAASLDRGMSFSLALKRATAASGLACLKSGAQSSLPSEDEIEENLKKIQPSRQVM